VLLLDKLAPKLKNPQKRIFMAALPRFRRFVALASALVVVAGGLTLAAPAENAAAASLASDAAAVLKKINTKRASLGMEKFSTNVALAAYAQAWADAMSTGGYGFAQMNPLPVDAVTGAAPEYLANSDWVYHFDRPESSRRRVIGDTLASNYESLWKARGYSHAAVGMVTRRSTTYYVLLVVDYPECAPGTLVSAKPTISGSGKVGEQLFASPGRWSPSADVRYLYEWRIDGRVVGDGRYYTPRTADATKRITVTVEGFKECYVTPGARTSDAKALRAGTLPVLTGDLNVGSTITADPGSWFRAGSTLTYDWQFTGGSYSLRELEVVPLTPGGRVTFVVTATAPGYKATKKTTTTIAIRDRLLPSRPEPTLSGHAIAGQTLSASAGDWGSESIDLTYVWRIDGATVPFVSGDQFVVPPRAVGKKVTVSVTGWRAGFAAATQTSAPTAIVAARNFAAGVVDIEGSPEVGQTIRAVTNWPSGAESCQWYRNGKVWGEPMNEAPNCSLTVTKKMRGANLTVVVTAKAPGYLTTSVKSAPVLAY